MQLHVISDVALNRLYNETGALTPAFNFLSTLKGRERQRGWGE